MVNKFTRGKLDVNFFGFGIFQVPRWTKIMERKWLTSLQGCSVGQRAEIKHCAAGKT